MYATHTTCSAHFLQSSSCPDELRQSCMPHTPHAVHVSFRPVLVQMDWGNHVCHTHHTQCTFPSDQFVSRWTGAIMYATHTTRSALFLQSSSCPDGLRQSCMPHTPHAVHVSFRPVRVQMDWTEAIMYAAHTTCSAHFLQTSSCPDGLRQSCMPHTPHACSARFLQTSSCPDGLRQSSMPHTPHAVHLSFRPVRVQMDWGNHVCHTHHTPHAVHVSFRPVRVQMDWGNHVCHTHHMQCTFPSDQFVSRYATHTTAVHVSFRPVRVQMD